MDRISQRYIKIYKNSVIMMEDRGYSTMQDPLEDMSKNIIYSTIKRHNTSLAVNSLPHDPSNSGALLDNDEIIENDYSVIILYISKRIGKS